MINLDTRILEKMNESELFLILQIVKRMQQNRMTAWPSVETLCKDCNWDERTVKKWRKSLIDRGFLEMNLKSGKPTVYRLKKTGISVWQPVENEDGYPEKEGTILEGTKNAPPQKMQGQKMCLGGVQKMTPELKVINSELIIKKSERDAHANSKPSKAEIAKRDGVAPPGPLENATDEYVNELVHRSRREAREFQAAIENSPKQTRTFEDAEREIARWAATEGLETVKYRHELARRKFNEKDLPQLAAHFCSIYGKPGGTDREQLLKDPIEFFRVGLNKYLTNQNQFDRSSVGIQGGQQGPSAALPNVSRNTRYT